MKITSRSVASPAALCAFLLASVADALAARDDESGDFHTSITHEFSIGGISRVGERDRGLIGGGNGGTGTSVNFDDGNLNYGRGLAYFAVQGKSKLSANSERAETAVEAVYFYDFLNANGKTDFRPLSDEARDRAGRGVYLNEAFVGLKQDIDDARLNLRVGKSPAQAGCCRASISSASDRRSRKRQAPT